MKPIDENKLVFNLTANDEVFNLSLDEFIKKVEVFKDFKIPYSCSIYILD